MIPWVILPTGDGMNEKGFKGEWMTVKGQKNYWNKSQFESSNISLAKDFVGYIQFERVYFTGVRELSSQPQLLSLSFEHKIRQFKETQASF